MVDCKYCGDETSNKNAICNSCKNKLNAKKYLKAVLDHFNPDEVIPKRDLGIYLDKSLNVDIVLLTLNDYGLVLRRGAHGYRLAKKEVLDEFLSQKDLSKIKSKKPSKRKSSKSKTTKKKSTSYSTPKPQENKVKALELKKCKICGSDLPENSKSDICRKCSKKAHAVKVLEEIIPITGVGIPFKKDDLNNLYENNPIKANDTIWTLQDFNLVETLDSNTFELTSKDILNQFFKENNSSNVVSELLSKTSDKALQKTCLKCNKTFSISEFRKISEDEYSDYCKSCDKKIKTANYAIEFIDNVGFNEFKITDVNIENAQGKIFNLQDNDLIIFNGQFYKLADEDKIYNYITQNMDETFQFDNIINAYKNHHTMIEAANSVGVSNVEVTRYYIEGKHGNPKYVYFFNEINNIKQSKIKNTPCPKCKKKAGYSDAKCNNCGYVNISLLSLDKKMDFVLSFIKENNSVKAAKKLDIPYENVKRWYDIGKRSISPYDKFYNGIINIKHESKDTVIKRNKISKIEERLNDNLRQIQRTELTLDKHIINLKSIDLSNRKIKSDNDEVTSEINIMKNDLIFQKNEIRSIKENLPNYSSDELDDVKVFNIKNTRSITIKVNKLLNKNDEYAKKLSNKSKKEIQRLENLLSKIKENIGQVEFNLSKLNDINWVKSLKSDYNRLIDELQNYKFNLNNDMEVIEENLFELKTKNSYSSSNILEINIIDYSIKVNDLISRNKNKILEQMNYIVDNLNENKTLELTCKDLNISCDDVKLWCSLGKSGEKDYVKFYDKINSFNIKKEMNKENVIKQCELKILKINTEIEKVDEYISQLNSEIFVSSLKSEEGILSSKLNNYRSKLVYSTETIESKLLKIKSSNDLTLNIYEIDFIDYSDKVKDLISKNHELTSKQMNLIINNLDINKDLKIISNNLNVSCNDVKTWYNLGKSGKSEYISFYRKINQYNEDKNNLIEKITSHEEKKDKQSNSNIFSKLVSKFKNDKKSQSMSKNTTQKYSSEKSNKEYQNTDTNMTQKSSPGKSNKEYQKELVLKYYKETGDLNQAANLANVAIFLVKFWYNSGKKGNQEFIDFYNQINEIKEP